LWLGTTRARRVVTDDAALRSWTHGEMAECPTDWTLVAAKVPVLFPRTETY